VVLARRAQALRSWDSLTIVPRYGFSDVSDYYARMSVGPRLRELRVPSLLVQSTLDPMVPPWTYEAHLATTLPKLCVRRLASGGHVAFPKVRFEPDSRRAEPLEDAVLSWLSLR